jgi:hypothetical protein
MAEKKLADAAMRVLLALLAAWSLLRELLAAPFRHLAALARGPPVPGVPSSVVFLSECGRREVIADAGGLIGALFVSQDSRADRVRCGLRAASSRGRPGPGVVVHDFGPGRLYLSLEYSIPETPLRGAPLLLARAGEVDLSARLREAGRGLAERILAAEPGAPGYSEIATYIRHRGQRLTGGDSIVLVSGNMRTIYLCPMRP